MGQYCTRYTPDSGPVLYHIYTCQWASTVPDTHLTMGQYCTWHVYLLPISSCRGIHCVVLVAWRPRSQSEGIPSLLRLTGGSWRRGKSSHHTSQLWYVTILGVLRESSVLINLNGSLRTKQMSACFSVQIMAWWPTEHREGSLTHVAISSRRVLCLGMTS